MMTNVCWERIIRVRWLSLVVALLVVALAAGSAPAADLALTELGAGINAYTTHDLTGAIAHLRAAHNKVPRLADYIAYYLGAAELQNKDPDAAVRVFAAYIANPVASSPLEGKIDVWYARALLDEKQAAASAKALTVLRSGYRVLPQPDGDYAMGLALEAQGDGAAAARSYQKVYYNAPNNDLAVDAGKALDRLRTALGASYPEATPAEQLGRAARWLDIKQPRKAQAEYTALAERLSGPDRDDARVGVGAAEQAVGVPSVALQHLKSVHPDSADIDARRLFYIVETARKMNDDSEIAAALNQLAAKHPQSQWRLKALISAGNQYVLVNDKERFDPLFRNAAQDFPPSPETAYSHWKVAWEAWLAGRPETVPLLREQVEKYPDDSRASSALFFLGRNAEKAGHPAEARAWYEQLSQQYQHYFYGVAARQRIETAGLTKVPADATTLAWLDTIDWPEHRDLTETTANAATRARIDRCRLLLAAGLPDTAQDEIAFGAKREVEQPHLLALELARSMPSAFLSLRIMKIFSGDYLSLPLENAPLKFWQMLFPLPYRDDVIRQAKARGLDPWLVAALIRQESEFNPSAKSHAGAYGLMQLMPPTGRELGRKDGVAVTSTAMLLNPALSIQLGTLYFKGQLGAWNGNLPQTLAAYNAGPGRLKQWLAWMTFNEPAEFIESIPFNETREYVQAVLRNADMYRALYDKPQAAPVEIADNSDVPPVKLASLPPAMAKKVAVAPRAAPKKKAVAKKAATTKSPAATKAAASRNSGN
jgi:soluble lytic murein transglycosylase